MHDVALQMMKRNAEAMGNVLGAMDYLTGDPSAMGREIALKILGKHGIQHKQGKVRSQPGHIFYLDTEGFDDHQSNLKSIRRNNGECGPTIGLWHTVASYLEGRRDARLPLQLSQMAQALIRHKGINAAQLYEAYYLNQVCHPEGKNDPIGAYPERREIHVMASLAENGSVRIEGEEVKIDLNKVDIPLSTIAMLPGVRLKTLIDHPLINRLNPTILQVRIDQQMLRLATCGGRKWPNDPVFRGGRPRTMVLRQIEEKRLKTLEHLKSR